MNCARIRLIERGKTLFGNDWFEHFVKATPLWQYQTIIHDGEQFTVGYTWYARIPFDEFAELYKLCHEDMMRRDIEAMYCF